MSSEGDRREDPERKEEEEEEEEEEFEDANSDLNDMTRPSEWSPGDKNIGSPAVSDEKDDSTEEGENKDFTDAKVDSVGNSVGSVDYVDEDGLEEEEKNLTEEIKEEKRMQANQFKVEGNNLYKEGKTAEAVDKYTAGLRICPLIFAKDRAVLYANRGQMKRVLGLNDQAVKNCSRAVELDPEYMKAILRRAEIYEETDKLDEALSDYKKVLELDPTQLEANRAVRRLPQKIDERNEKLKAEMMDSLKKLGNMVLKPFGLSTDNFNLEQDPNSGGYNIQFNQKKQ